jgi:hypothetical protein
MQTGMDRPEVDGGKQSNMTCFNCAEWGHYITECKQPKLCFICQATDHVGRNFPMWMKPLEPNQYLSSATQGLGFFHVVVQEEENKSGYLMFLDNCDVLTVEEGEIDSDEIIENLQFLFDSKWHWQLREIEEYKYLVRFPPQKQITATLISDVTYFKIKKEGVLVSLRAWNGDVEAYDYLDDVWVQIRGVPPKWSNWKSFNQIASSIGKMVEVDWNSLLSSLFSMIRVRIAKDASKVPSKRLFKMQKKLYLIKFKVEKNSEVDMGDDDGHDNNNDQGNEEDNGMEEFEHDDVPDHNHSTPKNKNITKKREVQQQGSKHSGDGGPSRKVATWASLFQDEEGCRRLDKSEIEDYSCIRLLREMEVLEHEEDEDMKLMDQDDEELVSIPKEWCEKLADDMRIDGLPEDVYTIPEMENTFPEEKPDVEGTRDTCFLQKNTKGKWGPTLVEKRPSRFQRDGRTMMEKAQERKKIVNLEKAKGISKTSNSFFVLDAEEICSAAKVVGISLGDDQTAESRSVSDIMNCDRDSSSTFDENCSL